MYASPIPAQSSRCRTANRSFLPHGIVHPTPGEVEPSSGLTQAHGLLESPATLKSQEVHDVIVVGAGHAGGEAARF